MLKPKRRRWIASTMMDGTGASYIRPSLCAQIIGFDGQPLHEHGAQVVHELATNWLLSVEPEGNA